MHIEGQQTLWRTLRDAPPGDLPVLGTVMSLWVAESTLSALLSADAANTLTSNQCVSFVSEFLLSLKDDQQG